MIATMAATRSVLHVSRKEAADGLTHARKKVRDAPAMIGASSCVNFESRAETCAEQVVLLKHRIGITRLQRPPPREGGVGWERGGG